MIITIAMIMMMIMIRMDTLEDLQTSGNSPDLEAREGVEELGL